MFNAIKAVVHNADFINRRPELVIASGPDRQLIECSGSPYKFAYSRTAFKHGLKAVGLGKGDSILVPGFICESAVEPLKILGIEIQYYPVDYRLRPMWEIMKALVKKTTSAIIIVHYFGQPQDIDICLKFCAQNSLLLIEDNAHGFGAVVNNRPLGTFGTIGFTSPRKSFPIKNGAYLYLTDKFFIEDLKLELTEKQSVSEQAGMKARIKKTGIVRYILKYKKIFNEYRNREAVIRQYSSQEYYRDEPFEIDFGMDKIYDEYLGTQDIGKIRCIRHKIYQLWQNFALGNGLEPVFSELSEDAMPLVFPAYAKSADERVKWFERGMAAGIDIHSWPTLPEDLVKKNREEMRLWEKLVCFPIHQEMDLNLLKKRIMLL